VSIRLAYGLHASPDEGMSLLEAVSWVAGEPFGDRPRCVSPALAAFGGAWNDALPDDDRDRLLVPLIPALIGTRTTEADDETRTWMATDWLVRVHAPAWIRRAGFGEEADRLEALPPLADGPEAAPLLDGARARALAVLEAGRRQVMAREWPAAGDLVRSCLRGYARDAARRAVGAAAGEPAWNAAWDPHTPGAKAVRAVAGDRARDAALAAAEAAAAAVALPVAAEAARLGWHACVAGEGAAWAAAWQRAWPAGGDPDDAAEEAWDAAWEAMGAPAAAREALVALDRRAAAAADAALRPVVEALQASALALVRAMCAVGRQGA
jgi:hypothetical protein